jgi:NAD(P)-dependent dehydrogenase (short-subunit alcohol dehydrogenase family)
MVKGAPLAVVIGSSRGLGREAARQLGLAGYRLVLAARSGDLLKATAKEFKARGIDVDVKALDVAKAGSVREFAKWLKSRTRSIEVLVNCAGVFLEDGKRGSSVLGAGEEEVLATIGINALGPWRTVRALASLVSDGGRIVNVSSGMASLTDMGSNYFGYRASKTMLNVLTRVLAQELQPKGILVNSVCPGWVSTDMGGPSATRSLAEGAAGIVWAATLPPDGPSGGFFRDGQALPW